MVELDHVMRTQDPDGNEADAVRDRMERPWYAMSAQEEQLVRGLSQDLYTIGTTRIAPNRDVIEVTDELAEALNKGNWVASLELLRREETRLPPGDVAAMRGVCWGSLNEHSAALVFIDEALRLAPDNAQFLVLRWTELIRDKRTSDAARDATARLSANSLTDSYTLFKAADVIVLYASLGPESEARRLYELAVGAVHEGLTRLPAEPLAGDLQFARIDAYLDLALSQAQLGHVEDAIEACDDVLHLDPARGDALMLRALLTQPVNPEAAKADVRRGFGVGLASRLAELPLTAVMTGASS
jgi:tetratricopeptide (TPR) repeat protein